MTTIIDIDHETGALSQYTSTVTDSGDLSVAAGAALGGPSYGLSVLIDDTTAIYGVATIMAYPTRWDTDSRDGCVGSWGGSSRTGFSIGWSLVRSSSWRPPNSVAGPRTGAESDRVVLANPARAGGAERPQ